MMVATSDNGNKVSTSQPVYGFRGMDEIDPPAEAPSPRSIKSRFTSSWDAKEEGSDIDYLANLGNANYNTNVDVGQSIAMGLDSHFVGNFLGLKSDIADGSLRNYEFRQFNNIVGDYWICPRFLEKVAIHFVKNYLVELGAISHR